MIFGVLDSIERKTLLKLTASRLALILIELVLDAGCDSSELKTNIGRNAQNG